MATTIKRCKTSFGFDINGMTRVVPAGSLVGTDDPAYKGFKEYFEDIETHVDEQRKLADRASNTPPPVEQATSAPGEKRETVRPSSPVRPVAKVVGTAHDATVKKS